MTDPLSYIDPNEHSMSISTIHSNEIKSIISKLNNSAPGYDNIPPKIGKLFATQYIDPLTYLINKSIKQGVFPDELKLPKLYPYLKQVMNNYFKTTDLYLYYLLYLKYMKQLLQII